jgi:hypothetical protein
MENHNQIIIKTHKQIKEYLEREFDNFLQYNRIHHNIRIIHKEGDSILFDYYTRPYTYRYVRVKDTSTDKFYFLSVPIEMQTCKQAVAWTFGLKPSEYSPIKET